MRDGGHRMLTVSDIVQNAERPCRVCGKSDPRLYRMYDKTGRRLELRAWCHQCGACLSPVVPEQKALFVAGEFFWPIVNCDQAQSAKWHAWADRRRASLAADRDAAWRRTYDDYMQSEAWRQRRLAALARDKHTCQSCLSAPAEQVHHLSYDHLGAEPLFELISVCVTCHDAIHKRNDARMPLPNASAMMPLADGTPF